MPIIAKDPPTKEEDPDSTSGGCSLFCGKDMWLPLTRNAVGPSVSESKN